MGKENLLALSPLDVSRSLTPEEVVHIATVLGAFWTYDYNAAEEGRVGMHALLKSGRHSDGFFVSRILLEPENIRLIISHQIAIRLLEAHIPRPDYVAGVPDGATKLGEDIALMLATQKAIMKKVKGHISLKTPIPSGKIVLLVEDFCTRGTGFKEAVLEVKRNQPKTYIIRFDPVIINRGGLKNFSVNGEIFSVLPVVERRIADWDATECPLCAKGSRAIKPKITDENWQMLIHSQE